VTGIACRGMPSVQSRRLYAVAEDENQSNVLLWCAEFGGHFYKPGNSANRTLHADECLNAVHLLVAIQDIVTVVNATCDECMHHRDECVHGIGWTGPLNWLKLL